MWSVKHVGRVRIHIMKKYLFVLSLILIISCSNSATPPNNSSGITSKTETQYQQTETKAKIQAEKISLQYRNKGMCVPILRPKSFVGPERLGVFALLFDWAKDGHNFPIIGNGKNHYQLMDVEDLCQAIYLCMQLNMEQVRINNIGIFAQDIGV